MPLIVVLDLLGVLIEVVQLEDNVSVDENAESLRTRRIGRS